MTFLSSMFLVNDIFIGCKTKGISIGLLYFPYLPMLQGAERTHEKPL